ncbi:hypothetical protein AMD27_16220 (plasmid) [Acinetobacter sp. TGL-Y2]|uniref:hypothetical protein n=1 Tax=Acinetobacter sp. TGL-Y2 TaxID=1407071 RepID=UPI0007A649E6|nr:hypothetical protein [Acinetobacter sp. TGL-Y2]AMW80463.1 hypothetical protein AMD27_16220 [Acinetobacter sp. TGL-Y2]
MSRLKEKIKSMDEKRFKNLCFILNLIAYTSLIIFIFSSSIIPYAIEIGSWLSSQNILDIVLVVSGIFLFTVSEYLKHPYNGNKRLISYEKPLVKKSGKFYKFMKTGIVILGCII